MQGKVIWGQRVLVFVHLHIKGVLCIGVLVDQKWNRVIVDGGVMCAQATFQYLDEVVQYGSRGRPVKFRCVFNGGGVQRFEVRFTPCFNS